MILASRARLIFFPSTLSTSPGNVSIFNLKETAKSMYMLNRANIAHKMTSITPNATPETLALAFHEK